jgi:Kef-type K+ transport system membrane component KefB
MHSIFLQLGVVTIVSAGLAIAFRALKQPIILAYIVAGILLGGGGYNLIPDSVNTQGIATVGIIFLLFLIGLELDIGRVRRVGKVVLMAGGIQMAVVAAGAAFFTLALGYPVSTALFLGLAAAFSSTAVVMKRLIDKQELASLHARVSIGILLLQDLIAVLALMLVSGIGTGSFDASVFVWFAIKAAVFFLVTWLFTKYLLGRIFFFIAKSTELLFLTSVAWAFLFAIICDALGFSKEIGAFVAGLSLATLPYNLEIIGRVKPLKDFFLVIFFVVIGLEVSLPVIAHNWVLILGLMLLVLFVKTLVTSAVMARSGYPKRASYLTGAGLGQMSEFSLLVVLLGASLGQVDHTIVPITATLVAATIIANTYWVEANRYLYPILVQPLKWLGANGRTKELGGKPPELSDHIIVFGANRAGHAVLSALKEGGRDILVVDHNPEVIRRLQRQGTTSVYGDIDDHELLGEIGVDRAKTIVSTAPNAAANLYLIKRVRERNRKALVVTTAEQIDEALAMYDAGADYVVVPHLLGGEQTAQLLEAVESRALKPQQLKAKRRQHVTHLKKRHSELTA